MIFKCKICGGELNVERGQNIVECEYCGVKQTLPRFLDDNIKRLYDMANSYLNHSEFDKAENIYNQILLADGRDADAYWNLVLCKYGVTYVNDPKSEKYIPTCNRTYYTSVFNDENYKKAIEYANDEKRNLYESDAKTIDDIQHGIIKISKQEKPFDIFISYKETAQNGGRTKDSIAAQELYDKLTNEGYKVFFSRITLEEKIGIEYEPYIYAALASSKIMITISSSRDNLESVWVKNEWSRFLAFAQMDSSKIILPLYFDMDKSQLPDEFAHLSAYDMKIDGFEQELIRGIKKLIPTPIMEKQRRYKRKRIFVKIGIVAAACLVIAAVCSIPWFMKLPQYNGAMQLYYDKNYPEATWAFDKLENYRDSKEMSEKCKLSWRKCLATVATSGSLTGSNDGDYYVTPNNTVKSFNSHSGGFGDEFGVNDHGKVISIAPNYWCLYALYEDGYVMNSNTTNGLEDDWEDIIQISPRFDDTSIALRADGTMISGELSEEDSWLEETINWKNIIAFDCDFSTYGAGGVMYGALIGIKSNGTLCGVIKSDNDGDSASALEQELDNFYDVNCISIKISPARKKYSIYGTVFYDAVDIIATTNHGTIQTYLNGEFSETDIGNIVSMNSNYTLCSDGNLYETLENAQHFEHSNKYLVSDVVRIGQGFAMDYCVTRSGSIYLSAESTEAKTVVYDEWLERMN